jgi:hypothetical protein
MSPLRIVVMCLAGLIASYGTLSTLRSSNFTAGPADGQISRAPAEAAGESSRLVPDIDRLATRSISRAQPASATLAPVPAWSPSMQSPSDGLSWEVGEATSAEDANAWAVMGAPWQARDLGAPLDADDPRSYELETPSLPKVSIGDAVEADRGVGRPLGPKTPINIGPVHSPDESLMRLAD